MTWRSRLARFRVHRSPSHIRAAIRALVEEAAQTVPYYRNLLASTNWSSRPSHGVDWLRRLPVTPRQRLTELPYQHFLRDGAREPRLYASHTSGSTGTPATIFLSQAELNYRRLVLVRAIRARYPGCLPTRITDVGQMTTQKMPRLAQRFGPLHLTRIPGNAPMSRQVEMYIESEPQLLEGYAGCLELLAEELSGHARYPRPRWVISRGEVLTSAARSRMQDAFDCPVADFYNSEEIGNMAWECRDRPGILHVNTDSAALELLDADCEPVSEGVEGRVVLTNLYNRTMPFIRYDIGDYATWETKTPHLCSCGAVTPTLSSIVGRTDDFIVLPDLRRISPLVVLTAVLNGAARETPSGAYVGQVLQFQVVQAEPGAAAVRVVPLGDLPEHLEQAIAQEFRKLHPAFLVHLELVNEIRPEASGKRKRIISRADEHR